MVSHILEPLPNPQYIDVFDTHRGNKNTALFPGYYSLLRLTEKLILDIESNPKRGWTHRWQLAMKNQQGIYIKTNWLIY